MHSSDNETVLGSSRKLGRAVKLLIDGSENTFVGGTLNLRVRMLLKGEVRIVPLKTFFNALLSQILFHPPCGVDIDHHITWRCVFTRRFVFSRSRASGKS